MSVTTTAVPGTADHLAPDVLDRAQRLLVAKAVAELSHERLLHPRPDGHGWALDAGDVVYRFAARRYPLEHWVVDPGSISAERDGAPADPDVLTLVAALASDLGLTDELLPVYLEELASTLRAAAWTLVHHEQTVDDLLHADLAATEAAMHAGHPGFLATNGRIGFSASQHEAYAPEAGRPVRLHWLGVRRSLSVASYAEGLDEDALLAHELDPATRERFELELRARGLDPAEYLLVPVHPWQWDHKIAVTFAPDLARHDLVHLGEGPDAYTAQQSIRTFLNVDHPERHYVKVALSIQNMGFMRGLSPRYMRATPAINDWVAGLVHADPDLQDCGFRVLRERAAVGYTGGVYQALEADSPYKKMLAALWRESPVTMVRDGERLATMASLLHRDADGNAYATALVRASGLDPIDWVRAYLRAYLRPVAHCLLAHDLAFMPHGENLILVLDGHVPRRVFMKDVGEEVVVMGDTPLPAEIERIRQDVPGELKALSVHTDVFDGFLRHLAGILAEDGVLGAGDFWALVGECLAQHAADHPELAAAREGCDLFAAEFAHSCLNRLQLRNTRQMVDLSDQASSLQMAGTLENPVAPHRP